MKNSYYSFAMKDYKSYHLFMEAGSDDYDTIVIFCQQFLEKYLKHLLELTQGIQNRGHKLTILANQLGYKDLNPYEDFLRKVQDYYFDKRYPGDYYTETTQDECTLVIKRTEELKIILDSILESISVDTKKEQLDVFNNFRK